MREKCLCLTFDDGPGVNSAEIGYYLHEQGIRATFFVVGKYAKDQANTLKELHRLGHIIGNHTFEHPDLPSYVAVNGDIQDQIIRTDVLIDAYCEGPVFFRAPYGKFSAEVAAELNANLMSACRHVGPVHWDIAGIDCYYWRTGRSVSEAADAYFDQIREKGKGIVVFHDEIADMDEVKPKNKTLELLKVLIPRLKSEAYHFAGLDEIPELKQAALRTVKFRLGIEGGKYVRQSGESLVLSRDYSSFSAEFRKEGKICLFDMHDHAWVVDPAGDLTMKARQYATNFDYLPVNNSRFMLRDLSGRYLSVLKGRMVSQSEYMRHATVFSFTPLNVPANTRLSFQQKIDLAQRRMRFIKSKLLGV